MCTNDEVDWVSHAQLWKSGMIIKGQSRRLGIRMSFSGNRLDAVYDGGNSEN